MVLSQGYMFYIDWYREKLKKYSCVKLEGTGLWYFVCHFIKAIFYVKFLFHQISKLS